MKKKKLCALALAAVLASPFCVGSISATAETWATNFKGVITETEADGFVYKNYYINKNDWLLGDNVVFPKYATGKEKDYIRFLDCNNRSLFGPRVRYEDFVCRFSVIMDNISLDGAGASLGLSFNRKTLYSYANDCAGIVFMRADAGTAVRVTQGDIDQSTGSVWLQYETEDSIDLWSKAGGRYDFMVVKSGDEAQLYYAEAGDTEGMKILRATVSGVRGEGFVAMCGMMGANFHLDDFGVWDLQDPLQDWSGCTGYGASAFCGERAVIGHGGGLLLTETEESLCASYGVKVTGGNSFACTLGEKFICFASDGSITGSQGLEPKMRGNFDFSAFEKGARVRLRKLRCTVFVEIDEGEGYELRAVFDAGSQNALQFGLRAGADASLIVEKPAIVSLAGKVDVPTKDYDPAVDVEPIRPKDISFDEYYGG